MELKKFSGVLYLSDNERFARHCGQGKISMKIPDHCVLDKRVQGLLNFYKQINTYLQINVNVIKSKVTGDKRGYTVAFDRKD